ncbi:MAG: hypothetical protein H6817_03645 [Phycisphaerales bacterium]|nr:hypothetical protein [Phycisphaerales bacterium]
MTNRDTATRRTGRFIIAFLCACTVRSAIVRADDVALDQALKDDVILRAMVDELNRETAELHLPDLADPYFIEYAAQDTQTAYVAAELGSIASKQVDHNRPMRVTVRVGSYELDNTNVGRGGSSTGGSLPIDNDYTAIRQALWWATDRNYKGVAEIFARKRAFMEQKVIEDKPDDFSREEPVVALEAPHELTLPVAEMEQIVCAASRVFRDFPDVQESSALIQGAAGNRYLVNSEGTRVRDGGTGMQLTVRATVQADDGMQLFDTITFAAEKISDFPSGDAIAIQCRQLAERLIKLKNAPRLKEAYTGPVLLDPEPASGLFGVQFTDRFAGGQRPVGSRSDPDDFEKKIGKRILPRSVSVIDDPTQERINGMLALGAYKHDDQGIAAQKVELVEGGRLQTQVMSRNPSRTLKHSNGHGNGFYNPDAAISCLIMSSDDAVDAAGMREELLEAAEDEDLPFGMRIASISQAGPLEVYRVYPDGREELVRGVDYVRITLRAFKRILAVGDTPFVRNIPGGDSYQTVVAPALLFEELDLTPVDRDFDKPPFLPSPLLAQKQAASDAATQ